MSSEIPLSKYGLVTVDDAAATKGWAVRSVQNWIAAGLIPFVRAGTGRRCVYLLREEDVKTFIPPARGRPPAKKPAAKGKARPKKQNPK